MSVACPACSAGAVASAASDLVPPNVTLSVPGMNCASCLTQVEQALNDLNGVSGARVNLTLRRVSAYSEIAESDLVQALERAGYVAFAMDGAVIDNQSDPMGRKLLLRLGVAGFAMMNVMLLSVAVWSGADLATRDLLHLISALIALPVVAFSAQPFFENAFKALKVWRLNMDVPISLAIGLAAAMSLFESLNGGQHAYFDAALSLTFFLLIGRYLEHRTKRMAKSAASDLAALEVHTAERWDDGKLKTTRTKDLAVGDRIFVPAGARVPVDGRLRSGTALTNRAFLTGESDPVQHQEGAAVRAGEINIGAPFDFVAEAVGEGTTIRQMVRMVETAENARNSYTNLADRAAQIYAPAVHLLAALAFVGWWIGTGDVRLSLNIAIAVLIITCPCALGLAVPAVATAAIGKLYGLGYLVKSGEALERLADVDTVTFDKTGTLTTPETGLGLDALTFEDKSVALALAQSSNHPMSQAIRAALAKITPAPLTNIEERANRGVQANFGTQKVALGSARWIGAAGEGTALCIGDRTTILNTNERVRDGAQSAVDGLKGLGLTLDLISGDTQSKTTELAEKLGIASYHADKSPQEKHAILSEQAAAGSKVCMIGDGLNDTIVLASAHASVAPGTALDAARSAADVVMVRENMTGLPELFRVSRKAAHLSRQNFAIATAYNLVAIPVALAGFATPLLAALAMSLSSITVMLNALRART